MSKKPCPTSAKTTEDLKKILSRITFQPSCVDFDWNFEVEELRFVTGAPLGGDNEDIGLKGWLVNTTFKRPDINNGKNGTGKGRQLFIARGASASGVFFTCWVLVDLIIKHEMMEAIRFNGRAN